MPDQVPDEVKHERLERLVDVVQRTLPSATRCASAASRRCSSRARAAPTRRSCAGGLGGTRPSTSRDRPPPATSSACSSRARPPRPSAAASSRSWRRDHGPDFTLSARFVTHATRFLVMLAVGGGPGCPKEMSQFPEVFAVFGPTASGKSEVAEALAGRLGTEVVSADALQVYRGLPILTNQPARPTRLVAICDLDHAMSVGEYARARARGDGRARRRERHRCRRGRDRSLPARRARRSRPPTGAERRARQRWERAYDADPRAAHEELASSTRLQPQRCTRTTGVVSFARSSSRRPARRSRRRARPPLVGGDAPTDPRRRARGVAGAPRARESGREPRRCSPPVSSRRYERRSLPGVSRTAEKALGLRELAEFPSEEALDRIVVENAPLRRVPAQVDATHPGDRHDRRRPTRGEVADAILEVARAR